MILVNHCVKLFFIGRHQTPFVFDFVSTWLWVVVWVFFFCKKKDSLYTPACNCCQCRTTFFCFVRSRCCICFWFVFFSADWKPCTYPTGVELQVSDSASDSAWCPRFFMSSTSSSHVLCVSSHSAHVHDWVTLRGYFWATRSPCSPVVLSVRCCCLDKQTGREVADNRFGPAWGPLTVTLIATLQEQRGRVWWGAWSLHFECLFCLLLWLSPEVL